MGESRADYACKRGNFSSLAVVRRDGNVLYLTRTVLIFARNRCLKKTNLSLSMSKSFASGNFDYMYAITLKYISCFESFRS